MSWDTLAWARRAKTGSVGRKAVLMVLAEHADEADSCFPSQAVLAEATEQSVRTVRTQLAQLEEMGLIRREHRSRQGGSGGRTTDRFYLLVDAEPKEGLPARFAGRSKEGLPANLNGVTGKTQGGNRQAVAAREQPLEELPPELPPSLPHIPLAVNGSTSAKPAPSQARGARIPDAFYVTAEMRAWAQAKVPNVNLVRETEKFCNYWRAKGGREARKLDWPATWRNWMLNADDSLQRTNGRVMTDREQSMSFLASVARGER